MRSEGTTKTFATFRVSGSELNPDDVTEFLNIWPTHAHKKGEHYSTGKSKVVAKSGVWLFSTDTISLSRSLHDHLELALFVIGAPSSKVDGSPPGTWVSDIEVSSKLLKLGEFLEDKAAKATLTIFWHGTSKAYCPALPDTLQRLLDRIPVSVDTDFDIDETAPRRREAK